MDKIKTDNKQPGAMLCIFLYILCAIPSIYIGLFGGMIFGSLLGFRREDCSWIGYYLCGSVLTAILSILIGLKWKNRAIFYGLNSFTILTIVQMLIWLKKWGI